MTTKEIKSTDALCNDASGFCVSAVGSMDPKTSGVYTSLVRLASQFQGHEGDVPLITIETAKGNLLVKEFDGHTVALRVPATVTTMESEASSS
jgi:hypothetical protein